MKPSAKSKTRRPAKSTPAKVVSRPAKSTLSAKEIGDIPLRVVGFLKAVVRRRYRYRVIRTLAWIVLGFSLIATTRCAIDWLLELPWIVRAVFLMLDIAGITFLIWKDVLRPLRKPFGLDEAALLVEKRTPGWHSELISAVQLGAKNPRGSIGGGANLLPALYRRAAEKVHRLSLDQIISLRPLRKVVIGAVAALVFALGIGFLTYPGSRVLMERLLLSTRPLPTKTLITAVTGSGIVTVGDQVEMVAQLEGVIPRSARLELKFDDGTFREIPLTVSSENRATYVVENVQRDFQYQFLAGDGKSREHAITVLHPPLITEIGFQLKYPEYTGLGTVEMSTADLRMFPGGEFFLTGMADQPIDTAEVIFNDESTRPLDVSRDGAFTATWTVDPEIPSSFHVRLTNAGGAPSTNPVIYRVQGQVDTPPTIETGETWPDDETITPAATLQFPIRIDDDFGIASASLRFRLVGDDDDDGSEAEAAADTEPVVVEEIPIPADSRSLSTVLSWRPGSHPDLTPGQNFEFWIEAADRNPNEEEGLATTSPQRMRIVTAAEKLQEIKERMEEGAGRARAISEEQDTLREELSRSEAGGD